MKNLRLSRVALAFGAGSLAFALTACGSDNAVPNTENEETPEETAAEATGEELSGSLAGAGASSQEAAMNAWIAKYQGVQPGVTVSYEPVGSGAGITQFIDKQVAWAGSDAVLEGDEITAAEERCGGPAINLPVYISPVAVIFNLEGVDNLNMDAETIAKVFAGEITNWNDPAIADQNPDVELPDLAITPVHRADKSGTTENFTDYLNKAAPEAWPHEPDKAWPIEGGESGDKTAGLVQAVNQGEGTIGYADASQAGDLGTVALQAGDGYIAFSNEAAATAADAAERVESGVEGDLGLEVNRKPEDAGAYPMVMISYAIVCTTYEDEETANLVKDFIGFQVSEEGQAAAEEAAGSAPLSSTMRDEVMKSLDMIGAAQ
ncbi:MAG: phosphate ABC transporter substrate-binding protein PstS [Actinomycetaceae bacterium]|nr:phosphate ABC transporter substrate-binding protein PstS [Actinomycetaceae bacterium]